MHLSKQSQLMVGLNILALGLAGCNVYVGPARPVVYAPAPRPYVYTPAPPTVQPASAEADPELQKLVAPVALYPDPLLAQLLPAATYPAKVTEADNWLHSNPSPSEEAIDGQDWPDQIKAMVHYPAALDYMAQNIDWTQSLGSAYSDNASNVMEAIQDCRRAAQGEGNLQSNAQVAVAVDGPTIAIMPAVEGQIFVPVYDPVAIYASPVAIVWGPPLVWGPWFNCGIFWGGGCVFVGDWHGGWGFHGGVWGFDHGWHGWQGHVWAHNNHFGGAPHIARGHYSFDHRVASAKFKTIGRSEAVKSHIKSNSVHTSRVREDLKTAGPHKETGKPAAGAKPGVARPTERGREGGHEEEHH